MFVCFQDSSKAIHHILDDDYSAQDIVRCDLCDTPVPNMHCDICHINLCETCVEEHLSIMPQKHKMVSFENREYTIRYPKCQKHPAELCLLQCKDCNIPVCSTCISLGDHEQHEEERLVEIFTKKKELIKRDLQEYKNIYPKYQEASSNIPHLKEEVKRQSDQLITALNRQRESLVTEIDSIIESMRDEIHDMNAQQIVSIDKQEEEVHSTVKKVNENIRHLQNLQDSDKVSLVSDYNTKNAKFPILPADLQVTLPTCNFTPRTINREEIGQQFGLLSKTNIKKILVRLLDDEQTSTTQDSSDSLQEFN